MRTIRTKVYQFSELSKAAQDKAIIDHITFLVECGLINEESIYWPAVEKMEKMQTPWFLGETLFHEYRQHIVAEIEANEYEFKADGTIF